MSIHSKDNDISSIYSLLSHLPPRWGRIPGFRRSNHSSPSKLTRVACQINRNPFHNFLLPASHSNKMNKFEGIVIARPSHRNTLHQTWEARSQCKNNSIEDSVFPTHNTQSTESKGEKESKRKTTLNDESFIGDNILWHVWVLDTFRTPILFHF